MFQLAAVIDHTLSSLNDPILAAAVVPRPEAFLRLLWISVGVTAVLLPWLVRHERAIGRLRRR